MNGAEVALERVLREAERIGALEPEDRAERAAILLPRFAQVVRAIINWKVRAYDDREEEMMRQVERALNALAEEA